ncbi:hypothetical protein G7048_07375 [Diaphorobacter sp. HDW4B]|uniref:hypothetical protein n=1 Tax=Diaphorobacter sp. HDW4B TaxID=2714925 RepID=UPI001408CD23|nr:hypothetical protein [Diaphorobacter sp. HDW4B]QIL70189.1 hypothetical protein G7048_07375 [Diaphorobacter sp. HDW4B]
MIIKKNKSFTRIFLFLFLIYGFWLAVFWPGILGEDSLAILLEAKDPLHHTSGKPVFWYYFVSVLYRKLQLIEIPMLTIVLICTSILARIISWCWTENLKKTAVFLFLFICAAPHLIYFVNSLYPDGFYAITVTGLLFEVWLTAKNKTASRTSLLMMAIALPVAAFARPNGIVFILPVLALIPLCDRKSRYWIAAILVVWCSLLALAIQVKKPQSHGSIFPLAIFETVNFLQPRIMNQWTWSPRISSATLEALTRNHPTEVYTQNYDPDYWDTLNFKPDGPRVMTMPKSDRKIIVIEFFRYNLWHNIPDFMGSRINVFLSSALADGSIPSLTYAQNVIERSGSNSNYHPFGLQRIEEKLNWLHHFTYQYRYLLWTPFLGLALLFMLLSQAVKERQIPILLVTVPMFLQLGGIFFFSIASEYRYLLPFFTLPLTLLPIYVMERRKTREKITPTVVK